MPSSNNWSEEERYKCDNCVPRGCSCNIIYYPEDIIRDNYEYYKDEKGRDLPCVEFDECETGYDIE